MSIKHDQEQTESFALGSSVYGGRPTFALTREEDENEVMVTLYELLPAEQAEARRQRLDRHRQQIAKTVPFEEIEDGDLGEGTDWTWDEWVGVKVRQLSGAHLKTILPLLRDTLREVEKNPSLITSTGAASVLLPEAPGVRLSLGFVGVKPLRRVDKMRSVVRGVAKMSLEECYYWSAKCRSPNTPQGEKALRVLLT